MTMLRNFIARKTRRFNLSIAAEKKPISNKDLKVFSALLVVLSGVGTLTGFLLKKAVEVPTCEIEGFPAPPWNSARKGLPSPRPQPTGDTGDIVYYTDLTVKRNWEEAFNYCEFHKMNLVSIYLPEEAEALSKLKTQVWTAGVPRSSGYAGYHWQLTNTTKSTHSAEDVIDIRMFDIGPEGNEDRTCLAFAGRNGGKNTLVARDCKVLLGTACENFPRKRLPLID